MPRAVYSYFAWHGGLAFKLRYFLPIFPFTSILVAYAWRELAHDLAPGWRRAIGIGALAVAAGGVWAAMIAFTYDAPRAYIFRTERAAFAQRLAPYMKADSILFVPTVSRFSACSTSIGCGSPN